MTDFNDVDTYNRDPMHDTWVDFNNSDNSRIPDVFF